MLKKGIYIATLLVCTLVLSFSIGYFLMDGAVKEPNDDKASESPLNQTAVAKTGEHKDKDVINENTKVKKTIRYTKGEEYQQSVIEAPADDMIGLNMEEAKKYFLDKGLSLASFTTEEIVVIGEIKDSWPPNHFVIKSDTENKIATYSVDSKGTLKLLDNLDIDFDSLEDGVKIHLQKGKIFELRDDLDTYIDETLDT